ncbi:MAG: DUF971 domain-containing protein [Candidatus Dadabacteria bacterium]|nr:DUF971 domain-containing protein [Candidatus Dadabacteria bacterium]NIQ14369.1 DUF971 domain-containing protein [Candidatus Dadabacteria bacterium]
MEYRPIEINEFTDTTLQIIWNDGHESIFLYDELIRMCPCAKCKKSKGAGKSAFKKRIPIGGNSLKPAKIEFVGNYALKFIGNNWCDTGFYTFNFLREKSQP